MIPQSQSERQAPARALFPDVPEGFEVALALRGGQSLHRNRMSRNVQQKRIRETQVVVEHDLVDQVVVPAAHAEGESVESLGHQFGQIFVPERVVIEPWFVLRLAGEQTGDAAYRVRRALRPGRHLRERRDRVRSTSRDVRELGQPVGDPERVVRDEGESGHVRGGLADKGERFRVPGVRDTHPIERFPRGRLVSACDP